MIGNTSSYVLHGLTVTVAGIGLAAIGLHLARRDVASIQRAGVNGLVLYLARSSCRSWWVRMAVQVMLLAFSLSLLSSQRVPYPLGADGWAVASIEFRRWAIVAVSVLVAGQSGLDLWSRRKAEEIAAAAKVGSPGP